MLAFATTATEEDVEVERRRVGDSSVYVATPQAVTTGDERAYLFIHGGWITGGGEIAEIGARYTAAALGIRTWAVDYRMAPYHPFPAALEDCLAVYAEMAGTSAPRNIAIGGVSGGANLALATLFRLRAEGLPLPAAAVLHTPFADMTYGGDSIQTNGGLDPAYVRDELDVIQQLHLGDHERNDPLVSPLRGEFSGLPPTALFTGTRDFLLSDTVRVHRRMRQAGVDAHLHVWEAGGHFLFGGTAPEDNERDREVRDFLERHVGGQAGSTTPDRVI